MYGFQLYKLFTCLNSCQSTFFLRNAAILKTKVRINVTIHHLATPSLLLQIICSLQSAVEGIGIL